MTVAMLRASISILPAFVWITHSFSFVSKAASSLANASAPVAAGQVELGERLVVQQRRGQIGDGLGEADRTNVAYDILLAVEHMGQGLSSNPPLSMLITTAKRPA